ncbi:MAG: hypothetical protein AAGA47_11265 [Pseudomonadota bacterium]
MAADVRALFEAAPWRSVTEGEIAHTLKVPTMLKLEESKFYYWLGATFGRDGGAFVDLGSFIGGSTARLAGGIMAGGRGGTVHAYDRFTAGAAVKRNVLYPAGIPRFAGNDILELSKDLLSPFAPHVVHHPGDINEQVWEGPPIDVVVHDASKTRVSADRQAAIFWPYLEAGRSIISQQDIVHSGHPWVAIQMELWADHFEPLAFVRGSTIPYLCVKVPSAADLGTRLTAALSTEEELALLRQAGERLGHLAPKVRKVLATAVDTLAANPDVDVAWKMTSNR